MIIRKISRTVLLRYLISAFIIIISAASCKREISPSGLHYYEVGIKNNPQDWRDSSFVVATADATLIAAIEAQLALPVEQRKIVNGKLRSGSGGYNKNATHTFKWHFKEDQWELADLSIEIYDGRPYNDVEREINYWLNTVKRFAPWGSYIKRKLVSP